MIKESFKSDQRGNRFPHRRAMHIWNELPEEVVEVGTIITFKRHLDRYTDRKGLERYGLGTSGTSSVRQLGGSKGQFEYGVAL